jgi:DNA-binding response OmpR family regulator
MQEGQKKILIIEDEPTVRVGLEDNLAFEGYNIFSCENGMKGLEIFRSESPDLVILDVMMPGMDGLEVCRQIRSLKSYVPIIMLTAKCGEIDKVVGLEIGADDYLTKPFAMRELVARIKAVLRRSGVNATLPIESSNATNGALNGVIALNFGDVNIDFQSYRAKKGETELLLSAKEFELMKFLAAKADIPVTRDQLLDEVWGYNNYPTTRTVDNFIARLRQKIEDFPDKPRHLLTVHGVGYKFVY